MLPGKRLLASTGQIRKIWFSLGLLFLGMMPIYLMELDVLNRTSEVTFLIIVMGLGASVTGMIYPCVAIKCPTCKAKWIWLMVSTNTEDPKHWDMRHEACNICGETGNGNT